MASRFTEQNAALYSDLTHLVRSINGYCSHTLPDNDGFNQEDYRYFKGVMNANGIIMGAEARNVTLDATKASEQAIKKTATKDDEAEINAVLRQVITDIKTFFSKEGKTQLAEAKDKSSAALAQMDTLDKTISLANSKTLLSPTAYFKPVSVNNVSPKIVRSIDSCNKKIIVVIDRFDKVNNLGKLITLYREIQNVVLASANKITDLIFDIIGELYAILESVNVNLTLAKQKTKDLQQLATLRNQFLAPCFVIAGSLPRVETLKNKNQ